MDIDSTRSVVVVVTLVFSTPGDRVCDKVAVVTDTSSGGATTSIVSSCLGPDLPPVSFSPTSISRVSLVRLSVSYKVTFLIP